MLKAFYTSATGMRAQEMLIDNTANNLANVNTTGFKRSHIEFADLIYDISKQPGAATADNQIAPIGLQIGNGVRSVGTTKVFTQGTPNQTNEPTHMAIQGNGFFQVTLPDGSLAYTRDGTFQRDANGQLVNAEGNFMEPAITIPIEASKVSIATTGQVEFIVNGQLQQAGQIQLFRFPNPAGLRSIGNNLYQETTASGVAQQGIPAQPGFGTILQGYYEGSNVEVVTELVNLITAQRAYEINSRAIRAGDEMLSNTSQIIR